MPAPLGLSQVGKEPIFVYFSPLCQYQNHFDRCRGIKLLKKILIILFLLTCETAWSTEQVSPQFTSWLMELRTEALEQGIGLGTLDAALTGITPISRVLELDSKQPEFTLTFAQYLKKVISKRRIQRGKDRIWKHRVLLRRAAKEYGVQARFLVALWGIETSYGRLTGGFPVIAALATLAYDGRRSAFFRKELFNALKIIDQGHISAEAMTGSWAGAMGQCQFMPSSFLQYAVDADGDGKKNIWLSLEDVISSIAKYLSQSGWDDKRTWGRKVRLPAKLDPQLIGLDTRKTLEEWQKLGLRRENGRNLPRVDIEASLLQPDGPGTDAFLVYENFHILLKWNRSHSFALSVGHLSNRLR